MSRIKRIEESQISDDGRQLLKTRLDDVWDRPFEVMLDMLHRPAIVKAGQDMYLAVLVNGTVPTPLKWMVGHVSSMTRGCMFCSAHTAYFAGANAQDIKKIEEIWNFEASPLFSEAEKAAFRFALAASSHPNASEEKHFDDMRLYFNEGEIVEILGVISFYAFFNCWNDTAHSQLEADPSTFAHQHLANSGWDIGVHAAPAEVGSV
jgi:alkylhydroperoxidase family enzyme